MHDLGLIPMLAAAFSAALILGYITQRLGLSPILGFLLAGVVIGPHTPGFVADGKIAGQLAEVGVILLMFGVGLHLHVKDLLAVKSIAVPGAVAQSVVATVLGTLVAYWAGWGLAAGLVLGIAVSVASTVVLMRVLVDNAVLDTSQGHIAVGWLVVEDIFTVLVLVLLPVASASLLAGSADAASIAKSVGLSLLNLAVFAALILVAGKRMIPWLLTRIARTRSRELFTLGVLALALAVAAGSAALFGASMALGAFLAGLVVGQSSVSEQAAAEALPMRDAFAVLFFVSVGMLFDPRFLVAQPGLVAAILGIVLVAKPAVALVLVIGLGYSIRTAITVAIGLAQIGEFSFILAQAAGSLHILPPEGYSLLVACAVISIALNPLLFRMIPRIEQALRTRPGLWGLLNRRVEARGRDANEDASKLLATKDGGARAVVVGYGPVGVTAARILKTFGIQSVVIDLNVDTVSRIRDMGGMAIYGDAAKDDILRTAGVEHAKHLVVTMPDPAYHVPVIQAARRLNPDLQVFSRSRYLAERETLERLGVTEVVYEEVEAAVGLTELLLRAEGTDERRIETETRRVREEFAPRKPARDRL
jgi:CPA2 family monovalent cation:H+ antiporter-2